MSAIQGPRGFALGGTLIIVGLIAGPGLPAAIASGPTPGASSSPAQSPRVEAPLPEGDYVTPSLTLDQIAQSVRDAGRSEADVQAWRDSMPPGSEVFILRLRDGRLYGGNATDGGKPEFGWEGDYAFLDDHTLVADDGRGAVTIGFQRDGGEVDFKVLKDLNPYPNDISYQIAFYEAAPFTPAGGSASAQVTPSPPATADPIPQGDYVSGPVDAALIASTLRAAGFPDTDIQQVIAAVGATTAVFTLRLRDGVLTELQSSDGRPPVIGWRGAYLFADDHTLVADDGATDMYSFTWQDGALHIDVVQDLAADPIDFAIQTAIYESTPFTPARTTGETPATSQVP